MTLPRRAQVALSATPYYHCVARCVRRAYLCGRDDYTGKNFEHRRQWLLDRIGQQANVFAIDVCSYAIMSNHYHLVIRVDERQARDWTDAEVVQRWTRLYRGPLLIRQWLEGKSLSPAEQQSVADIVAVWRSRLFDLSWYMRCLNEFIARQANAEDDCTGRFWEGRFKSQALLGDAALLACMQYVDLNPVRAGMAGTLDDSDFTSIQARIRQHAAMRMGRSPDTDGVPLAAFRCSASTETTAPPLPWDLQTYIGLVEATGRQAAHGKRGELSDEVLGLFERLQLSARDWVTLSRDVRASSLRAIGSLDQHEMYSYATGRKRRHGAGPQRSVTGR